MSQVHIKTKINGDNIEFLCDPEETLLDILRDKLGFKGKVFSDALDMKAAHSAGQPLGRINAALNAGCDYVIYCNDREGLLSALRHLN